MEVFDKEGVAVKKNRSEGFVMAEVLVTVLFVTVFTSLLFSSGARRYRSALNFAAGTEARLAAEAVVQILVENKETDWNAIWEMQNTGNRQRSIWRLMEKNFWNRDISRKKRRIPEPSRSRDSGCP